MGKINAFIPNDIESSCPAFTSVSDLLDQFTDATDAIIPNVYIANYVSQCNDVHSWYKNIAFTETCQKAPTYLFWSLLFVVVFILLSIVMISLSIAWKTNTELFLEISYTEEEAETGVPAPAPDGEDERKDRMRRIHQHSSRVRIDESREVHFSNGDDFWKSKSSRRDIPSRKGELFSRHSQRREVETDILEDISAPSFIDSPAADSLVGDTQFFGDFIDSSSASLVPIGDVQYFDDPEPSFVGSLAAGSLVGDMQYFDDPKEHGEVEVSFDQSLTNYRASWDNAEGNHVSDFLHFCDFFHLMDVDNSIIADALELTELERRQTGDRGLSDGLNEDNDFFEDVDGNGMIYQDDNSEDLIFGPEESGYSEGGSEEFDINQGVQREYSPGQPMLNSSGDFIMEEDHVINQEMERRYSPAPPMVNDVHGFNMEEDSPTGQYRLNDFMLTRNEVGAHPMFTELDPHGGSYETTEAYGGYTYSNESNQRDINGGALSSSLSLNQYDSEIELHVDSQDNANQAHLDEEAQCFGETADPHRIANATGYWNPPMDNRADFGAQFDRQHYAEKSLSIPQNERDEARMQNSLHQPSYQQVSPNFIPQSNYSEGMPRPRSLPTPPIKNQEESDYSMPYPRSLPIPRIRNQEESDYSMPHPRSLPIPPIRNQEKSDYKQEKEDYKKKTRRKSPSNEKQKHRAPDDGAPVDTRSYLEGFRQQHQQQEAQQRYYTEFREQLPPRHYMSLQGNMTKITIAPKLALAPTREYPSMTKIKVSPKRRNRAPTPEDSSAVPRDNSGLDSRDSSPERSRREEKSKYDSSLDSRDSSPKRSRRKGKSKYDSSLDSRDSSPARSRRKGISKYDSRLDSRDSSPERSRRKGKSKYDSGLDSRNSSPERSRRTGKPKYVRSDSSLDYSTSDGGSSSDYTDDSYTSSETSYESRRRRSSRRNKSSHDRRTSSRRRR